MQCRAPAVRQLLINRSPPQPFLQRPYIPLIFQACPHGFVLFLQPRFIFCKFLVANLIIRHTIMPPSFSFPLFYIGGTHFSAVKLSCKNTTLQSFLAFFAKNSFFLNLYPHSCPICQKSAHPAGYSVPSRNHPRILSPRLLPIPFGLSVPRLSCSLASRLLNPLRIHFTICSHVSLAAKAAHPSGCAAFASSLLTNRESYGIL